MPVLAKLNGVVIRMLSHRTFGTHLHAIYGDDELVIGLKPVRVIQGQVPSWVRAFALDWVRRHEHDFHSCFSNARPRGRVESGSGVAWRRGFLSFGA